MKKVLILSSLFLIGLTSCKKDRTCTCTSTSTFSSNGTTSISNGTSTTTIKKADKQHGNLLCSSYNSSDTQTGANGYTSTSRTDCVLK